MKSAKRKNAGNPAVNIAVLLLLAVLVTSYMTSGLYAKYTSEMYGGGAAAAEEFAFNVKDKETAVNVFSGLDITEPGDSAEWDFCVHNGSSANPCRVDTSYTITLSASGDMPVSYTIVNSSGTTVLSGTLKGAAGAADTETYTCLTKFEAGKYRSDEYALTIFWDAEDNGVEYANTDCSIEITFEAEQAK